MAYKELERERQRDPGEPDQYRVSLTSRIHPAYAQPGDQQNQCAQDDRADDMAGFLAKAGRDEDFAHASVQDGQDHDHEPDGKSFHKHQGTKRLVCLQTGG